MIKKHCNLQNMSKKCEIYSYFIDRFLKCEKNVLSVMNGKYVNITALQPKKLHQWHK